jgi:DNA repair exonuclease SbcCD ATPase subunit
VYLNSFFQIKSLQIKNFKCFTNLDLDFKISFNFISGLAGTGKTIIFECINLIANPKYHNNIKLKLKKELSKGKKLSTISGEIIPVDLNYFKENISNFNFSKELQDILLKKNSQSFIIELKIDPLTNEISNYLINDFSVTNEELNSWVRFLNRDLSRQVHSTQQNNFLSKSFFSNDIASDKRYQILVSQLKLTKTKNQFQTLQEEIRLFNNKSNELDETIFEAKALEDELLKDLALLNEFTNETEKLRLLENELVWAPFIQTEDRINALTTATATTNQEIEKIKQEIESKELLREDLVREINEIDKNKKQKDQEFETIRKEYLEKKSRIDKHNKQMENFEKSIKRFTFDERQKQMKISDNQRLITEITTKKKNNQSSDNEVKEVKLKEELVHLQKEFEEIKEKKSAYQKERTVKQSSKKKLESFTNSLSTKLQTVRESIGNYETKSDELVKQNDLIYKSIDDLNEKLMQIEEKLGDTNKEIKTSQKDLLKLQKEVKKSGISKPEIVRAKNTIDTLINNSKQRINQLENLNLNKNSESQLQKHKERLNSLQTEIENINSKNQMLDSQLQEWENNWEGTLSQLIQKIEEKMNRFLVSWNISIKIELLFPDSLTNGYLNVNFIKNDENYSSKYLSSSQIAIFNFIWQLSLSIIADYSLLVVDEIFSLLNPVDQEILLKTIKDSYNEKIINKNFQFILMAYFKDLHSLSEEEFLLINLDST